MSDAKPFRREALLVRALRQRPLSSDNRSLVAAAAIERLCNALLEANDICRSMYQVAARDGVNTTWSTLHHRLDRALTHQHEVMYPVKTKKGVGR